MKLILFIIAISITAWLVYKILIGSYKESDSYEYHEMVKNERKEREYLDKL